MAAQKKKKGEKKEKTKKETNIIKIHVSIKGQHKVKGESSSIREAEETGIWTMYLTPHRHALGTTMNKRQESRKKNKPERGRPTELHRAIHPNKERENRTLTVYSPEMRRRAGQGLGNDRELLHMLTMDTGKSQKGHGGHQENIQLPETEGNLRLGFLQRI